MTPIRLYHLVELDICNARCWYDSRELGLADLFEEAVLATFDRILATPQRFISVTDQHKRAKVLSYPYGVIYLLDADAIVIMGVHHDSQDIQPFLNRYA